MTKFLRWEPISTMCVHCTQMNMFCFQFSRQYNTYRYYSVCAFLLLLVFTVHVQSIYYYVIVNVFKQSASNELNVRMPDKCINIYQPNKYKAFCSDNDGSDGGGCYLILSCSLSLFYSSLLKLPVNCLSTDKLID